MSAEFIRDGLPMAQGLHFEMLWFGSNGFRCFRGGRNAIADADRVAGVDSASTA